ncbi:Molybdopterin biosynthesis protein MoeA [Rhodospirillaceae bacterium LM-1]|nr:Molybdopterin biosynthesis protein MoeA [Rhodospirillaceae bacterium LM-1]
MLSVEEAQALVLSDLTQLGSETVAVSQALGRVLAQPATARTSHPTADVSAMDGWAVRAADGLNLNQIGESSAGHPFKGTVGKGQCVRIFTGAVMPTGADSVAIQEEVRAEGAAITLAAPAPLGQHVRKRGQDFTQGQTLLSPGRRLSSRDIALLAAMNLPWIAVNRRPRVAVLSTGDELALPGEPIPEGGLPNSNSLMLMACIQEWGGEAFDLGIARDDFDSLVAKAKSATGCDLLITTGGVSVGAYDKVKDALAALGFSAGFHKIAMKPGKPLMFGHMGNLPVLGLPGNPVSAYVSAVLFLKPMLRRMQGLSPALPLPVPAMLAAPLPPGGGRQEYLRAHIETAQDGTLAVHPCPAQDSAMLSELSSANALILRPIKAAAAKAGDHVPVLPLD